MSKDSGNNQFNNNINNNVTSVTNIQNPPPQNITNFASQINQPTNYTNMISPQINATQTHKLPLHYGFGNRDFTNIGRRR